jgi:heme oxygenase
MTLFNRIRTAIARSHDQIEKTNYSIAIMSGGMHVSDYVVSLAQLHAIHKTLEETVASSPSSDLFYPEMVRTSALERDLAFWGTELASLESMPETLSTCELIRDTIAENPVSAIGFIYVLEGSRMGSLVIVKPLSKSLGVTPVDSQGLDYHTEGARQTPARLARWKAEVEQRDWTESQMVAVESTAVSFMESLTRLYEKLPVSAAADKSLLRADVA